MAPTIPSTALVPTAPVFTNTERLALAGFLAGYSGLTRQAYELDLRQFTAGATSTSCICSRRSVSAHIRLLCITVLFSLS
jgi:hypothetical protein